MKVFLETRRAH